MSSSSTGDAAPSPPHARDVLLHLEAYLARRDGVDKLLKISRYAAKLALTSPSVALTPLGPRLRSFESSVGLSRKAFRLGKFLQDLNSLRSLPSPISPLLLSLSLLAYAGEGTYYFLEQFVWLAKSGLIPKHHLSRLQYLSAWAELLGYCGSIAIKLREEASLRSKIDDAKDAGERGKLQEKLTMKRLSIVQDLADALMALADVRDGKGHLTGPRLMASAGLASALISAHKNWRSC